MKSIVPVAFATDDKFAPLCAVAIGSLIANCDKTRLYRVYILYDDLSPEHRRKLTGMGRDNVTVETVPAGNYVDRETLYVRDWLTVTSYFRIFAANVLSQYDKALYLDSDVVILGDVGELYDIDIGDNLLGAAVDCLNTNPELRKEYSPFFKSVLGVSPRKYFNSGVLSMNLRLLRAEGIVEKCVAFLREHRTLRWLDQDTLNAVCRNRVHYLPWEWNFYQIYMPGVRLDRQTFENIRIIHYVGCIKPGWVPFQQPHILFYQYALLTPYREELNRQILDINSPAPKPAMNKNLAVRTVADLFRYGQLGPRWLMRFAKQWGKGLLRRCKRKLKPGSDLPHG